MVKNKDLVDLLGRSGPQIYNVADAQNNTLDSYIVAYFTKINKRCKTIFDLGCGTGAIAMYMSLRTNANIIGVEIQEDIAHLAEEAVKVNKMDIITILNKDIKDLPKHYMPSCADLVVSNPPYFKVGCGKENDNEKYDLARREVAIDLDSLVKVASYLLKDGCSFSFVHRAERFLEIIDVLKKYHLVPKRIMMIHPKKTQDAELIFIEAMKNASMDGLKILSPLYIFNNDGSYTKKALKIFNGEF